MSLLLDALKRAEEAKRAKESAESPSPPRQPSEPPVFAEDPGLAPLEAKPTANFELVPDRDEHVPAAHALPKAPPKAVPVAAPMAPREEPHFASELAIEEPLDELMASTHSARDNDQRDQRDTARNVFAAKQPALSSRGGKWLLPLIAFLVLGIGACAWYVWMEVRKVSRPIVGAPIVTAPVPPPAPAATQTAATGDKAAKEAKPALPPLLPPPAKEVPLPAAAAKAPVSTVTLTEREALAKDIREAPAAPGSPVQLRLSKSFELPKVNPDLLAGYQALTKGDYGRAAALYTRAAEAEPFNIDAHLGLAAASARNGDFATAARHYRRVLEIDPRNSMAISGLLAVGGQAQPGALENELKVLIGRNPDAPTLYFSLGNLYAADGRWTDAQQAYFDACRLEPANADYLYNLAVSLDHLGQFPLALDYYQRALSAKSAGQYDRRAVARRIDELKAN